MGVRVSGLPRIVRRVDAAAGVEGRRFRREVALVVERSVRHPRSSAAQAAIDSCKGARTSDELLRMAESGMASTATMVTICWLIPRLRGGPRNRAFLGVVSGMIGHRAPTVRGEAAMSAGLFTLPSATPILLAATRHGDDGVKLRAVWGLGLASGKRSAIRLLEVLADPEAGSRVRACAADALASHPGHAVREALLDGLDDPSLLVRLSAMHSLGELREVRALAVLERMAEASSPRVRRGARDALSRIRRTEI